MSVVSDPAVAGLLAQIAAMALLCRSCALLLGDAGLLAFDRALYAGIGGWVAVVAMREAPVWGLSLPWVPLLSGVVAAVLAGVLGLVLARRDGTGFAMMTLALGEAAHRLLLGLPALSGGAQGLSADRTALAPVVIPSWLPGQPRAWDFGPAAQMLALTAVWVLAALAVMQWSVRGRRGLLLHAVRDDAGRLELLGASAARIRWQALVVAGAGAGIGGALLAMLFEAFDVAATSPARSADVLLYAVIGGVASVRGAWAGAAAGVLCAVVLPAWTAAWPLYLGLLFGARVLRSVRGGGDDAGTGLAGAAGAATQRAGAIASVPKPAGAVARLAKRHGPVATVSKPAGVVATTSAWAGRPLAVASVVVGIESLYALVHPDTPGRLGLLVVPAGHPLAGALAGLGLAGVIAAARAIGAARGGGHGRVGRTGRDGRDGHGDRRAPGTTAGDGIEPRTAPHRDTPDTPDTPDTSDTSDPRSAGAPVLELRGIGRRFGACTALAGVDLTVAAGECVALLGANGAGKSTLLDVASGRQRADAGCVRVNGRTMRRTGAHRFARCGLRRSLQHGGTFGSLTVREHLLCAHLAARRAPPARLPVTLDAHRDRRPAQLPYAARRWLELEMTLANEPAVVLLDEPTAGLDPQAREAVVRRLRARAPAQAVLLVEHDLHVVAALADRVVVLAAGRVVASGTPRLVAADPLARAAYPGLHALHEAA